MTNWMSALLAARLERIAGIATFTIETSSSTMNSAVITLARASQRRGSSSLAGGAGAAGCAPAPGAETASVVSVIRRASRDRASGPCHSPAVRRSILPESRLTRARATAPVHRPASGPFSAVCTIPTASTANMVATWLRRIRRPRVALRAGETAARERGQDEQADRRRPGPDADLLAGGKVGAGD